MGSLGVSVHLRGTHEGMQGRAPRGERGELLGERLERGERLGEGGLRRQAARALGRHVLALAHHLLEQVLPAQTAWERFELRGFGIKGRASKASLAHPLACQT